MEHLDEERLFQLALEQLEAGEQALAEAHLGACEDCRRRHASLSSIVFSRTVPGDSGKAGPNTRPERAADGGPPLQRGANLGRYVLLEKLGAGGMGEVFAAYDPQLDRRVALKLLRGGSLTAEEGKARLLREAQAMARLQHPNVIAVHDVGEFRDRVFIAMEFVDGETVAEWQRGARTWSEVLKLFTEAGAGLAAAHRAGLVHRDFKPDNVLLGTDGRPRVLDFGLARQSTATPAAGTRAGDVPEGLGDSPLSQTLTRDGAVMGTPGYMAPEQLAGLPTDERSDQFSFCVALYEGLYGRRPFGGATLKAHAVEMASGKVPEPPPGSTAPRWLFDVLTRGLSPDPGKRWPDMVALLLALKPPPERGRRVSAAFAGVAVLALLGVGYGVSVRQRLTVCGGQDRSLAGVWDSGQRARLKQAFADTKLPFATETWGSVEKTLDAWALDWVGTAREVCEATRVRKVDSNELYELRRTCLDERLQRLRSLVTLFEQPDRQVVVNAAAAARSLEAAQACGGRTLKDQLAHDAAERAAEAALRLKMADAQALFAAGKYALAVAALEPSLAHAAPDRVLAEAWLLVGRAKTKLADTKGSGAAHLAAAEHAVRAGDEDLEAMAFSRLSANEGYDADGVNAETLLRLAKAAASRVPDAWEVQAELARNEAFVELGRRQTTLARDHFARVLALQRSHLPAEHPEIASTLNNIGMALATLRQFDDAIPFLAQSLAIHEAVEGAHHPNTATAQHNLAVTLRSQGRFADAKRLFERALEVRREALGATNAETLRSQLALARTLVSLDELEAAATNVAEVRRGREATNQFTPREQWEVLEVESDIALAGGFWKEAAVIEAAMVTLGRDDKAEPTWLTRALLLRGRALTELGSWAEAKRVLGEVGALLAARDEKEKERKGDDRDADLALAVGRLELEQGRPDQARPSFEQAVSLRDATTQPQGLATAQLELGRCALEQGKLDEAGALAAAALERLAKQPAPVLVARVKVLAAQAAWLAQPEDQAKGAAFGEAAAALPEAEQARLEAWVKGKHLVVPVTDAGVGVAP
jgi:tetratricopeptide (TPR) repeat protein